MSESGERACDFCGTVAMSNVAIEGRRTVAYCDGPPGATIPSVVLCYDCAEEVTAYVDARRGADADSDSSASFSADDVQALVGRAREHSDLVLETEAGHSFGFRYVDDEWQHAVTRLPSPPTVERLDEADVVERVRNANEITLKVLDEAAWNRFAAER